MESPSIRPCAPPRRPPPGAAPSSTYGSCVTNDGSAGPRSPAPGSQARCIAPSWPTCSACPCRVAAAPRMSRAAAAKAVFARATTRLPSGVLDPAWRRAGRHPERRPTRAPRAPCAPQGLLDRLRRGSVLPSAPALASAAAGSAADFPPVPGLGFAGLGRPRAWSRPRLFIPVRLLRLLLGVASSPADASPLPSAPPRRVRPPPCRRRPWRSAAGP